MTNLEALKANISDTHGIIITDNGWIKALYDAGSNPDDAYDTSDEQSVDLATIDILERVLETANISDGNLNYTITNKEYIEKRIDSIRLSYGMGYKYGKSNKPTVRGRSVW